MFAFWVLLLLSFMGGLLVGMMPKSNQPAGKPPMPVVKVSPSVQITIYGDNVTEKTIKRAESLAQAILPPFQEEKNHAGTSASR